LITNAELPLAIGRQRFEAIARRNPQVLKRYGRIQLRQLPQRDP